jgi:hypothetical protein
LIHYEFRHDNNIKWNMLKCMDLLSWLIAPISQSKSISNNVYKIWTRNGKMKSWFGIAVTMMGQTTSEYHVDGCGCPISCCITGKMIFLVLRDHLLKIEYHWNRCLGTFEIFHLFIITHEQFQSNRVYNCFNKCFRGTTLLPEFYNNNNNDNNNNNNNKNSNTTCKYALMNIEC